MYNLRMLPIRLLYIAFDHSSDYKRRNILIEENDHTCFRLGKKKMKRLFWPMLGQYDLFGTEYVFLLAFSVQGLTL